MKTLTAEAAGTPVRIRVLPMGEDLCVAVSGGDREHIGAVALAEPRPSLRDGKTTSATVSVLAVTGHKEDELARGVAKEMASALNARVSVSCGIHVDQAGDRQIGEVVAAVGELTREMIRILQDRGG
ncbi:prenylated flavin chaperone LpdD [Desulfoplanes sp.]